MRLRSHVSHQLANRFAAAAVGVIAVLTHTVPAMMAQSIPPKGGAGTFEVASWNIEFFGGNGGPSDDDRQISNVREVILDSQVDLWALQEIADEADFFDMVASLGSAYSGLLAPTSKSQGLGLAYVYRNDVVQLRNAREVLTQFTSEFAGRPPYQIEADIVLPDTTVRVTLINVHMKAQSDRDSYDKRAAASVRLKNHIDFTTLATRPVLILGDLNDLLLNSITSGRASPYKNFVDDIGNYDTPTLQMQLDERSTFCGSSSLCRGSTIDHIIITNEVEPWYVED
ncbi:MAG: endonuclease/exonuclease/phosphatase family protein, partial [Rhodothermales bacterium]|nr:endonuclease/exonuclease/phosphatase family protein [Rhodothermales bacterium]